MKDFPLVLVHANGSVMTLDATRLLLRVDEQLSLPETLVLVAATNLVLEPDEAPPDPAEASLRVAHAPGVFWVRDVDGTAIDQARFDATVLALGDSLESIGAVYRLAGRTGQEGLLCPLPTVLIVRPAPGIDADGEARLARLLESFGLFELEEITAQLNGDRYFVRRGANPSPVYDLRELVVASGLGLIEQATFEHLPLLRPFAGTTNDRLLAAQLYLDAIHARDAWDLLDPSDQTPVVVAVIDQGVDLNHPDLTLLNLGADLDPLSASGTGAPALVVNSAGSMVVVNHGTGVAGVIGMRHDNTDGGAGVCRDVVIFSARISLVSDISLIRAINVSVDNGAQVINMSFGAIVAFVSQPYDAARIGVALDRADDLGCVLCAAAGNDNVPIVCFPASHPRVIACGALDKSLIARFNLGLLGSNTGPELTVMAPSELLVTATLVGQGPPDTRAQLGPDHRLVGFGQTSFACAAVSGVAALLVKKYPALTPAEIRRVIARTAVRVGIVPYAEDRPSGRWDTDLGFGRVDAFRALDFGDVRIRHHTADDGIEPTPPGIDVTTSSDIVVSAIDFSPPERAFSTTPNTASGRAIAGVSNFVYVRVLNDGPAAARNVAVSVRIVSSARRPFVLADFRASDLEHLFLPPDPQKSFVSALPAGTSTVFKFTLFSTVADLILAGGLSGLTFSVLAEVTCDNDYSHLFGVSLAGNDLERRRNNLARRDLLAVPLTTSSNPLVGAPPPGAPGGGDDDPGDDDPGDDDPGDDDSGDDDPGGGGPDGPDVPDGPATPVAPPLPRAHLLRPLDFLDLEFEFVNLALDRSEQPARLVRANRAQPAFVVVHFAPQSIAESAFLEGRKQADDFVPDGGVGGVKSPLPTEPPSVPIQRRIAGGSRVAFRVPEAIRSLPFTVAGLLDWAKLEPSISERAVSQSAASAKRPTAPISAPAPTETAIEAPWRLVVSPNEKSGWRHASAPVTHAGRTELWHTRLGVRSGANVLEDQADERSLRALWSPDYRALPAVPPKDDVPFRSSLSADDRHQIVRLSSDFNIKERRGVKGEAKASLVHYRPRPIEVDRFMLSPLGAWAELRGDWDLTLGARAREGLSVEAWQQIATQGRDHFVRVVYGGRVFPGGHRASLIKTTERKVQTIDGQPVAVLRQRFNVLIRQPHRSYTPAAYPHHGREMPLAAGIRIHTHLTPDLDLPGKIANTRRSFWIAEADEPFRFACTGSDVRGRAVDFQMAAIFASDEDLDKIGLPGIHAEYAKAENAERRRCRVGGHKMAFAPSDPTRPDSTTLDTEFFELLAVAPVEHIEPPLAPEDVIPFLPCVGAALVRLPAVEQLVGNLGAQSICFGDAYLKNLPNAGAVFAEVTSQAVLGVPAERAGGLATPNLTITGLSERLGPVAGKMDKLASGVFEPASFFDPSARLLGGIALSDIIQSNFADAQLPSMRTSVIDEPDGTQVALTTLSFKPTLREFGPFRFQTDRAATLSIETSVRRRLGSAAAPTQTVEGVLSHFVLNLVDVIGVTFDALRFTRNAAGTLDVAAELPDDAILFDGPLKFVNELRKAIPPSLFGGGLSLDVQPSGVSAGFCIALPPLEVGVLSIKNAALSASVFLPFLQGQARLRFAFAERHRPFQLAVYLFGGGGFLALAVGLDGVEMIEGALEFGGSFSINLGVASGGVEAMAGFYFKWEVKDEIDKVTLTGYFRIQGAVEVLGLVTVSVTVYVGLSYLPDPGGGIGKVQGQAALTVKVEVAMFSKSVTLTVEKSFGGTASDPPFGDLIDAQDWLAYSEAFA